MKLLLPSLLSNAKYAASTRTPCLFSARTNGTKSPSPVTRTATSIILPKPTCRASTARATSTPFSPCVCDMGRYLGSTPACIKSWCRLRSRFKPLLSQRDAFLQEEMELGEAKPAQLPLVVVVVLCVREERSVVEDTQPADRAALPHARPFTFLSLRNC